MFLNERLKLSRQTGAIIRERAVMPSFQISSVQAPPPIAAIRPIETPKPPKAQSDHHPVNPPTSSRGPAVVLSGALAKPPERHGQQTQAQAEATGQHLNHVI